MGLFSWIAGGLVKGAVKGVGGVAKDIIQTINDAKEKKLTHEEAMAKLEHYGDQLQVSTNNLEAASNNVFIAGWRPFVGWVCGLGLAYSFLVAPLTNGLFVAFHWGATGPLPSLDIATLLTILLGMLGLSKLRTDEKVAGAQDNH